ncbi:hypothetical protein J0910_11355 [Nocardiopsis sp. CNT-189]|uniref:hypothetical protein n=1 Tax=Nocardiopsis oceanisediminis TaxID=2816862 RepID=UPI003B29625C
MATVDAGTAGPGALTRERSGRTRAGRLLHAAGGLLRALSDGARVLPEAEPAEIRRLLIETGHLDPGALPGVRPAALARFQHEAGLPGTGAADPRTVSRLAAEAARIRELRELGLPVG